MCVYSHLCTFCAVASGTRLTLVSRGADGDRRVRINYSVHTRGLLARMERTHTHTHNTYFEDVCLLCHLVHDQKYLK